MQNTLLRSSLLALTTFAIGITAPKAEAFTITDSGNLQSINAEIFDLFNSSVNHESLAMDENMLPELLANTIKWDGLSSSIDVFFINEGAGYRNQLLFSINDGPQTMLFDDIASSDSILKEDDGPLSLGDGKSITGLSGNIGIDFLVKANGKWNNNANLFGADTSTNADGLQHVIAREFRQGNDNWVLMGFEDLYGVHYSEGGSSDRDFNDVVIAVRGVTGNRVDSAASTPEPMVTLSLMIVGTIGATTLRRHRWA